MIREHWINPLIDRNKSVPLLTALLCLTAMTAIMWLLGVWLGVSIAGGWDCVAAECTTVEVPE